MRVDPTEICQCRSGETFGPIGIFVATKVKVVSGLVVAVEIRRRDLGARVVALENEPVVGQRSSSVQARVEEVDDDQVEATVDGHKGEKGAGGKYREDVVEDLERGIC